MTTAAGQSSPSFQSRRYPVLQWQADKDTPRLSRTLLALGVIWCCSLVVLWRGIFGGQLYWEGDTLTYYLPVLQTYQAALRDWQLPLWTPLIYGGHPLFAEGEGGMLYPVNIVLTRLLPLVAQIYTWQMVIRFGLAGTFAFWFGRVLGLSRSGALISGLVFAFGSFMVAQMHHSNVVDSAVWIPAVLAAIEYATRARGWTWVRWIVLSGLAFGCAMLAVHVEVVLMCAMLVVGWCSLRAAGPRLRPGHRLLALVTAPAVFVVGAAVAAVQWLPLFQLSQLANRGEGLSYTSATDFVLSPPDLITLLFPFFFQGPDNHWWTLWLHWETTLYVGIVPLGLAVLGLTFVRSIETWWFGVCGILGLLIALGENSPIGAFWLLWHTPGLAFLRAPGRFSLVCVLAAAMLAGYGLTWLVASGHKTGRVRKFGIGLVSFTLVLLLAGTRGGDWVATNPTQALALIQNFYLSFPHDLTHPIDPSFVVRGLTLSLDPVHSRSAMTLLLLGGFGLLLATWSTASFRVRNGTLAIIGLVVVDLLVFASSFHQIGRGDALSQPSPVAQFLASQPGDYRYFGGTNPPPGTEPNRLLDVGVPDAGGYSSLTLSRVADYLKRARSGNPSLLDLLHVRYLGAIEQPSALPTFQQVQYQPDHPIVRLTPADASRSFDLAANAESATELRLIGYLINDRHIPQGTVVAIAHVETTSGGPAQDVAIRAGVEIADQGIELPLTDPPKHQPAQIALAVPIRTATGAESRVLTYFAALPLEGGPVVSRVTIQFVFTDGEMDILGLGLAGPDGAVRQLTSTDTPQSAKTAPASGVIVYTDPTATVTENASVMDRAFLVYSARTVPADSHPLDALATPDFDPRESVLLEAPAPTDLPGVRPDGGSATLVEQSSQSIQIHVDTPEPAMLVLADTNYPGWSATVDGAQAPIVTADSIFRAVEIPAGAHRVEFDFRPLTFRIGAGISVLAVILAAALLGVSVLRDRALRRV